MTEYEPYRDQRPIDPTKCRESVSDRRGFADHQCGSHAVVDGRWRKQHRPAAKAARRAKSDAGKQAKKNSSPLALLSKVRERIGQLKAENKRLREQSDGGPLL